MKTSTTLAMALALVSICALLAAGILVLYLDWRGKLLRRVLNEREERQELDTAA